MKLTSQKALWPPDFVLIVLAVALVTCAPFLAQAAVENVPAETAAEIPAVQAVPPPVTSPRQIVAPIITVPSAEVKDPGAPDTPIVNTPPSGFAASQFQLHKAEPFACNTINEGSVALTSQAQACVCAPGNRWLVINATPALACAWSAENATEKGADDSPSK